MVNTKVTLSGLTLDNPVIPASGTFGYGKEFLDYYDINILGSFVTKGTTLHPRFGNPTPRIAECTAGMINSVGLQNPGIHHVIEQELTDLRSFYTKPVIVNICGFSIEEYATCSELMNQQDQVGILEINISCPNVHDGGMAFGTDWHSAADVTRAVKKATTKPVYMKLSPNVTDIVTIARACEDSGADGVSLINTLQAMRINVATQKPVLHNVIGGLSGPALFPIALRMVWQVTQAVKIPVMGIGGVVSARDVIEMMLAGASAVQVGTQNLVDPFACKRIIDDLPLEMHALGMEDLPKKIGGVF